MNTDRIDEYSEELINSNHVELTAINQNTRHSVSSVDVSACRLWLDVGKAEVWWVKTVYWTYLEIRVCAQFNFIPCWTFSFVRETSFGLACLRSSLSELLCLNLHFLEGASWLACLLACLLLLLKVCVLLNQVSAGGQPDFFFLNEWRNEQTVHTLCMCIFPLQLHVHTVHIHIWCVIYNKYISSIVIYSGIFLQVVMRLFSGQLEQWDSECFIKNTIEQT